VSGSCLRFPCQDGLRIRAKGEKWYEINEMSEPIGFDIFSILCENKYSIINYNIVTVYLYISDASFG